MVAAATAELEVLVQIKDAVANLEKVSQSADKQATQMDKAFGAIKVTAAAAFAVLASKQIIGFFEAGIDAASAQQTAMAQLNQQLVLTGEASQTALDDFAAFADTMESTTKFGDDVILTQIGIAKSFGVSNEQAKKLVTAATELSAATGKDLESSVRTLGKSLSGTLGPLDDNIQAFKGLTKEQLAAGEQFDLIIDRFGGSAAAELETFAGSITQASNAWGNFQEAAGAIIVENPQVIAAIQGIKDLFNILEQSVKDNKDALSEFVTNGIGFVVSGIGGSIESFVLLIGIIDNIKSVALDTATAIAAMLSVIPSFSEKAESIGVAIAEANNSSTDWLEGIGVASAEASLKFDEAANKIATATNKHADATDKIVTSSDKRKVSYEKEGDAAKDAAKKTEDLLKAGEKERANFQSLKGETPLTGSQQLDLEKQDAEFKAQLESQKQAEIQTAKDVAAEKRKIQEDSNKEVFSAIGSIVGSGNGRAAAENAGLMLGKGVANAFVPGLGEAVGPILGVLMQGPEATKQFIKDFIGAIPDIIIAISEALPVVGEVLVDQLVNEGGAVRIGVAIIRAMAGEGIAKSIGKQIGLEFGSAFNSSNIAQTISNSFGAGAAKLREFPASLNAAITRFQNAGHDAGTAISNALRAAPEAIKAGFDAGLVSAQTAVSAGISEAVGKIGASIQDALDILALPTIPTPPWLEDFTDAVDSLLGFELPSVGGSGGGITGGIIPGLATGITEVPRGFNNDTFPALLSSGERVVDTEANADLKAFLARPAADGGMTVAAVALLARIASLLEGGQTVNAEIKVGSDALAKAILNLNRRGARIA